MTACTIVIERRDDGRYEATCSVFPDLEIVADTEQAARDGMEEAIGRVVRQRLGIDEPPDGNPIL